MTLIVLGTCPESFQNWLSDVSISKLDLPYPGAKDAAIHSGFWHAYNNTALRPGIHSALKDEFLGGQSMFSKPRLVVTGHSLGGAMAYLAALDLQKSFDISKSEIRVVTVGSPRVGNQMFAKFFSRMIPQSTRLVNNLDIVPTMPPMREGFYHAPNEVWLYDSSIGPVHQDVEYPIVWMNTEFSNKTDDCRSDWCGLFVDRCISIFDHLFVMGINLGWKTVKSCKEISKSNLSQLQD